MTFRRQKNFPFFKLWGYNFDFWSLETLFRVHNNGLCTVNQTAYSMHVRKFLSRRQFETSWIWYSELLWLISQRLCSREEKLSFIIVFVYFFKSPMNHQIWTRYHHFLQMSHTNRAAIQRNNDALMLWSIDVEFVTGSIQMPFKISIFLISP